MVEILEPISDLGVGRVPKARSWPLLIAWKWPVLGGLIAALVLYAAGPIIRDRFLRYEGHVVVVDNPAVSVNAQSGETVEAQFLIRNISGEMVRIEGIETSCGCLAASQLPLSIEPGASGELVLRLDASADAGDTIVRRAKLFVSVPSPPVFVEIHVCVASVG